MTRRELTLYLFFLLCLFAGVITVHVMDAIDEIQATEESYGAR